jgi:hypothetical protein
MEEGSTGSGGGGEGGGRRTGEVKDEDGSRVPSKVTENGEI